jgi:multidrug resistance protein, MATE family
MTDAAALRASSEVAAPGLGSRWIWHLALGALPIISFYFAEVAMSLTDAAFVGHIGNQELAAVGLSMGSLFPLLFGAIALVSTGGVFIAEAAAVGNQGGAKQSLDLSLWAVVAVSRSCH